LAKRAAFWSPETSQAPSQIVRRSFIVLAHPPPLARKSTARRCIAIDSPWLDGQCTYANRWRYVRDSH
jgi:hypothetical protein